MSTNQWNQFTNLNDETERRIPGTKSYTRTIELLEGPAKKAKEVGEKLANFADRQQYKAAVQDWKVAYAELSVYIRNVKQVHRELHVRGRYATYTFLEASRLKEVAKTFISVRHAAKERAQEQYLASRAVSA